MDRIGRLYPTTTTREGRMLSGGRLTATVTSKRSNQHVTVRIRCARKDQAGVWHRAEFADASHVFIEDYDGQRIATYYPQAGQVWWERRSTRAGRWTAESVLRWCAGDMPDLTDIAFIDAADFCGRCGQQLTDPISLERGFGPDCYGLATRSRATPALA